MEKAAIDLQQYYPAEMEIQKIEQEEKRLVIHMSSQTKSCRCQHCGEQAVKKRATYKRKAQDLPILGRQVILVINIHEYQCEKCNRPVAESFDGFLLRRSRLTERCRNFIVQLALETNCEGASRILKEIGIDYSGDSIIRLLLERLEEMPEPEIGSAIGVDDFAFRKGHTYGTIIVDSMTHRPVAILDGRDGKTLREWLAKNRHIMTVSRDRASEYARAVEEVLPDAIQVADRFHLYKNMSEAVKKAVNMIIPSAVPAEEVEGLSSVEEESKKRDS